jgi:hypothetical protein
MRTIESEQMVSCRVSLLHRKYDVIRLLIHSVNGLSGFHYPRILPGDNESKSRITPTETPKWRRDANALAQRASKSLRRLLQLALERIHLLRNIFQLLFRERSRFRELMSLPIGFANRRPDSNGNLRQLAFLGHRSPSVPATAILYTSPQPPVNAAKRDEQIV